MMTNDVADMTVGDLEAMLAAKGLRLAGVAETRGGYRARLRSEVEVCIQGARLLEATGTGSSFTTAIADAYRGWCEAEQVAARRRLLAVYPVEA